MKLDIIKIFLFLFFITGNLLSQNIKISGSITDAATGETLPNAIVKDLENVKNTIIANEYGYYNITVQNPIYLEISFAGYKPLIMELNLLKDSLINIPLAQTELQIVEVKSNKNDNFYHQKTQMSHIDLPIQTIKSIPALGGEADPLKVLTLMPGVKFGTEGSTGLFVRGSTPDQNLILLDDAPVYNPSHLFGVISVFNTDALKKVELYKGGVPSRYGGRAASVTNIMMKEGNHQKHSGVFGVGILSSKLLLEGPLKKEKTSYLFSARSSYFDLLNAKNYLDYRKYGGEYFTYRFYDMNVKVNHKISERNHLFFSFYHSNDIYVNKTKLTTEQNNLGLNWNNLTFTTRYNRIISAKAFYKSILSISKYAYNIDTQSKKLQEDEINILNNSNIFDLTFRNQFEYYPNSNHQMKMGIEVSNKRYNPAEVKLVNRGINTLSENRRSQLLETGLFIEDEILINDNLSTNIGIRFSSAFLKEKLYFLPEPRASLRYNISSNWALKGSYNLMAQYSHMLASNALGLSNDVWVPVNEDTPPQYNHHFALGIGGTFDDGSQEVSLETYYKLLYNQIDFSEGANLIFNLGDKWSDLIEKNGKGKAYGVELLYQKKHGKWTGWIGYTLAWNFRQFDRINGGKVFPFKYDRRHEVSLVLHKQMKNPKWHFAFNWVFATGNAVTLPVGRYNPPNGLPTYGPETILITLSERNAYRMPSFHRLDLGFQRKVLTIKKREKEWSFGAYNAYNRQNPFYIKISETGTNSGVLYNISQKSLFPIVPYISYSLKW